MDYNQSSMENVVYLIIINRQKCRQNRNVDLMVAPPSIWIGFISSIACAAAIICIQNDKDQRG